MSNENELDLNQQDGENGGEPTRKQLLMQKARIMGITFSNNISEEALAAKIDEKLEGKKPAVVASNDAGLNPLAGDTAGRELTAKLTLRQRLMRDQMKMVRVRITNMDPKKKDLHGEIMTVANEYLGTVRKFIPFGEATEDGYHVPQCLLTMMQERKFLQIRTIKDKRTGATRPETSWAREFAIEVLPPLSQGELKQLATAQIAAGTVGSNSD